MAIGNRASDKNAYNLIESSFFFCDSEEFSCKKLPCIFSVLPVILREAAAEWNFSILFLV